MKKNDDLTGGRDQPNEFLLYLSPDGKVKVEVFLHDENMWLTQERMAELFGVQRPAITKHVSNIFSEGELKEDEVSSILEHTSKHGSAAGKTQTQKVKYYNLDVIIAVGYRVNSHKATQFRIWATQILKEYIVKGFVMDDERLKEPQGARYFEELLARIRDIRSSEKVFWRKVLDIYATSIDYDPSAESAQSFFKKVQNMMHWAAHGHTAAELIYNRADAEQPNMGITNYPGNKLLKRDVEIAKNYLSENELNVLNRIVTAYLEVAELQALNRIPMTMRDWTERLHQFLTMTGRKLLEDAGKISHEAALQKAHEEYEKYSIKQLNEPTDVERHFIEAEQELKQIESEKKK